jgi:hypothetical protein
MPVCSAGSERQELAPSTITLYPVHMGILFPEELKWVLPYLNFIPPITINLDDFCALDPPADPEFTLADALSLIAPSRYSFAVLAGQKLAQLVHIFLWYRFCQCIDLAAPTPPPTITAPTGLPVINPPGYTAPGYGVNPCAVWHYDMSATWLTATRSTPEAILKPAGATTLRVWFDIHSANWLARLQLVETTAPTTGTVQTRQVAARDINEGTIYDGTGVNTTGYYDLTPNSGGDYAYFVFGANGTSGTHEGTATVSFDAQWFCGTDPDVPVTPPDPCVACPPDPYVTAQLSLLLAGLRDISAQVDLIQRQQVPFAYVPGTLHSDLSGAGELAVTGLIGAKVSITATTPGTIGSETGHPEHLFGAGWIQWGSSDGFSSRTWLDQVDTLSFPDAAGAYTLLAYSLPPGVVVDILELEREP